jgi:hypothetical protein
MNRTADQCVSEAAARMRVGGVGFGRAPAVTLAQRTRFRLATLAIGILIGLAASWRVLLEPGVVGLVHDWSIPPFAGQNVALLQQMFDGWYRWALGIAIAYPLEYPLRLVLGAAGALGVDGRVLSKAVVVLAPAGSFVAMTWLARSCKLSQRAAWLAGAFYALDPVMLNKLVSGQMTYLLGYVALPLVPALFLSRADARRAGLAGVAIGGVLALTAVQVQLGVIASILLLVLAALSTDVPAARRALMVGAAFVTMAAIELPTLVWLTHGVTGIEQLDQFGHRAAWLKANSIAPADAVRLIGYLAHYDISATFGWTPAWAVASWAVVVAVAIGLFALRGPMRVVCGVAVVVTIAFVGGTSTFLSPAITWLFEHVPLAQMFRELYHAMAVVSLAYALAIGAAFDWLERWPRARIAQGALVVVVAGFVAPMLSGDVSGWLQAAPVDDYLAPAYRDVDRGPGSVVWFPLDQPLAFDGYGTGVDPMAVTQRGSMWLYALTWPLTAVDMTARMDDQPLLRDELRALGVGVAVNRSRMTSRFATFSADGSVARRLFLRPLAFGPALGTAHVYDPTLTSYTLPGGPLVAYEAFGAAVVPQRLAVIAELSLAHVAPFGFAQPPPAGIPYAVYDDAADRAWESLQLAGLSRPIDAPAVNARGHFAGGDVWWWYRQPYADSDRFSVAIGAAQTLIPAGRALADANLVVAWIATPAGGELEATCGRVRRVLETGGAWAAWRSTTIDCGPVPAGGHAVLRALNPSAEVALRGAQFVDADTLRAATARFAALLHDALFVAPLRSGVDGGVRFARTGRSPQIGVVERGKPALLEVERSDAGGDVAFTVRAPDGYVVAWQRFAPGRRVVVVPFVGDGTPLWLRVSGAHIAGWRLAVLERATQMPTRAVPPPVRSRLFVLNATFDRGWQVDGATAHLPTALGTNVFATPSDSGAAEPRARFSFSTGYHVAFAIGTLALALALLAGLALLLDGDGGRRPRLAEGKRHS